jgi:pimeloyl-CoA synthetase
MFLSSGLGDHSYLFEDLCFMDDLESPTGRIISRLKSLAPVYGTLRGSQQCSGTFVLDISTGQRLGRQGETRQS